MTARETIQPISTAINYTNIIAVAITVAIATWTKAAPEGMEWCF